MSCIYAASESHIRIDIDEDLNQCKNTNHKP